MLLYGVKIIAKVNHGSEFDCDGNSCTISRTVASITLTAVFWSQPQRRFDCTGLLNSKKIRKMKQNVSERKIHLQ